MLNYYYPRTIRTIVTALINMFDSISVYNYIDAVSGSTSAANVINVPVHFGPQDKKYSSRAEEETSKRYYVNLPAISILWKNAQYDSGRATGTNEYRYFYNDSISLHDVTSYFEDIQPSPYNFSFDMKIRTNSMDHLCQISEQILPYFNPVLNLRVKEFSFLNIERNFKVKLDGIDLEYQDEIDQENRREVNGSISISVEAVLYKPHDEAGIIKEIISNFYISTSTSAIDVSGVNSDYFKLVEHYETSGVEGFETSAFPMGSRYDTSAYDVLTDVYTFTSASGHF